jgi:serine/threonine-protein kinase HipA
MLLPEIGISVLKVILWGKDVDVAIWDADKEYATIEFCESFVKEGIDIAPIAMPLDDMQRGNRLFSFPAHREKILFPFIC